MQAHNKPVTTKNATKWLTKAMDIQTCKGKMGKPDGS